MAGEIIDTAYVEIRPLTAGFGAAAAAGTRAGLAGSQAAIARSGASSGALFAGGLAKGLKGFAGITLATFGVEKLAKGLRSAVDESAQLQKQTEAVGLEFGKAGSKVVDFAKGASSFGFSQRQSEELSVRIGILAHNLGIGQKKAADITTGLQELGGSIAEIRGKKPEELLGNLPQVLAGNLRSLKQLGFAFSNTEIKQQAVTEGLIKQTGALTPAAKAQAIYTLLMQQSAHFQEQAAKHSGDLVNQEHRLSAESSNLAGSIGNLAKGPFTLLTKALADGAHGLGQYVNNLQKNEKVTRAAHGVTEGLGKLFHALFQVFKDNKQTIGKVFSTLGESMRIAFVLAKPLVILLGGVLVLALKAMFAAIKLNLRIITALQNAFKDAAGIIIGAIDKLLGGFAVLAEGLSHVPLVGDKFKGVADKINAAREKLRSFRDELQGINGSSADVTVRVTVKTFGAELKNPLFTDTLAGIAPTPKPKAKAKGPTGPPFKNPGTFKAPPPVLKPTTSLPTNALAQEQLLQDNVSAEQAKGNVAAEETALRALAHFYGILSQKQKYSVALRRALHVRELQTNAQITALQQQTADAAKAAGVTAKNAADQAKKNAKDKVQAAVDERRNTLDANLRIAQTTQGTLKDDIRAERALIAFYRERVRALKGTGSQLRAAIADLRGARNDLRALQDQEAQTRKDRITTRLTATEDRLKDNLTLAGFTKGTGDDRRALTALERFYQQRVNASKLKSAARRKWRIELEGTRQQIKDLSATEKGVADAEKSLIQQQAFSFLTTQQGFASNLAGNLLGSTAGLVGGTAGGAAGATPATPLPTPAGEDRLPGRQGIAAAAAREQGGATPRATQLETLIHLGRQQLTQLQLLRASNAHPEARTSRALTHSGTEVGAA